MLRGNKTGGPTQARKQLFTLSKPERDRVPFLVIVFSLFCLGLLSRMFVLQVVQAPYYKALAQGQRALIEQLLPSRGQVLVRDVNTGGSSRWPKIRKPSLSMPCRAKSRIPTQLLQAWPPH